jgi:hypothetical protein
VGGGGPRAVTAGIHIGRSVSVAHYCVSGVFFLFFYVEVVSIPLLHKMEQIEYYETSANINQTPGKRPKDSTLNTKHGENLKSRIFMHVHGLQCGPLL